MSYPRHIAIIMDGNGRWAHARGLPRVAGHKAGMHTLHKIVHHAGKIGLQWLTVFAFSSENWRRPVEEVNHLMSLLKLFIKRDLADLHKHNVRIQVIGQRKTIATDIGALLQEAEELTKMNTGLNLVVAFNYGGRDELTQAVHKIAHQIELGQLHSDDIDETVIEKYLDTVNIPDPDLIIRTSGEQRLSNFLLWQSAYSELYFSPCYWPDFDENKFDDAISDFHSRERRFGALQECDKHREAL